MARTRYAPDRGLSARMGLTMFLLGVLYVVLMAVVISFTTIPWFFIVVLALGLAWGQWYFSDRLALSAMRGRVVTPEEAPELHAMVDRLCALADMPKPKVAIADVDIPNAFATGRSPDRAVVCVTTGLMGRLEQQELEGVLAHELSHVAHRDVTVMTTASVVAVLAGLLVRSAMWSSMFGGRGRDNNNTALVFLVVMLVSVVVYALSYLLIRALSRYRELSADRTGALLTGRPSALGSALVKISGEMGRIPTRDLRQVEAYNAFFIFPAFTKGFDFSTLFSTHPPLDRRLEQLTKISSQLGQAG
ncbi:MAG: zinc metalloprotease HtpX [Actinomycetes bacterium]